MPLHAESPSNFEPKTICCLVLDTSTSMSDKPINELNISIKQFHEDISKDSITSQRLEIAIVTFNSKVEIIQEPELVSYFTIPTLTTGGSTKLVDGVREAINLIQKRKEYYKDSGQQYYRPWIILITDGAPDDDQDTEGLGREIREGMNNKSFIFLAIGVENANMKVLKSISGYLKEKPVEPELLKGLQFKDFFEWLSASMAVLSQSGPGNKVKIPEDDKWTDDSWKDEFEV